MIDPDIRRGLNTNRIAVLGQDFRAGDVTDDDVGYVFDVEADSDESGGGVLSDDGLVARNADFGRAGDGAGDVDYGWSIGCSGFGEGSEGRDGCGCAACSASGAVCGQYQRPRRPQWRAWEGTTYPPFSLA